MTTLNKGDRVRIGDLVCTVWQSKSSGKTGLKVLPSDMSKPLTAANDACIKAREALTAAEAARDVVLTREAKKPIHGRVMFGDLNVETAKADKPVASNAAPVAIDESVAMAYLNR